MSCQVTDDCVNFVIEHFQENQYGSVNFLAGRYLKEVGIPRPYGKLTALEDKVKRPILTCKHVISITMRRLEEQGYLKQFSRTSWGRIAPVPSDANISMRIKLGEVMKGRIAT